MKTAQKSKPEKRSAICPSCYRRVQAGIPKGGDGSVDVYATHKGKHGNRCNYSMAIVKHTYS